MVGYKVLHKKRAGILCGLHISRQPRSEAREDNHATPIQGNDRNPAGSPSCPPECFDSLGRPVVVHVHGRVEWDENDPTSMDTINRDLVRCIRVLQVLGSIPVPIKVDTAAVDSRIQVIRVTWSGQRIIAFSDS